MSARLRWGIALILSAAIALSYLDRQTLPVAIGAIRKDISISNQGFAMLNNAFLLAYALMYAVGGRALDLLGTRTGFTIAMLFWSLACASHGLATGFGMLMVSRFMLGVGEGGGFPAATRALAEWFPVSERSSAMGIINGGSSVGAVIAPPLIAFVILNSNWRWVFVVTGALGLVWVVAWRLIYFPPQSHPGLSEKAREELVSRLSVTSSNEPPVRWLDLLKIRELWGILGAKFVSDAAWYFYLFWLPKYLLDDRGFDIKAIGAFAWIPAGASGIGCLVSGSLSSWLLWKSRTLNFSRKVVIGGCAAVMPLVALVPHVPVAVAIGLFTLAYFGHQAWSTLVMVLPADLFPTRAVGSVAGLLGCAGALGGVAFSQLAGYLLDHHFGYVPVFAIAGSFHVIAFLTICVFVPVIQPLKLNFNQQPK